MTSSATLRAAALLLTAVGAGAAASSVQAADSTAADHLVFSTQFDARCHNLSEGGKMTMMANTHPDKAIRYRLIRMFMEAPQAGRAIGVIEPGTEPTKLGCDKVDKRPQTWRVERAEFVEPAPREAAAAEGAVHAQEPK